MNKHRSSYYDILKSAKNDTTFSLGLEDIDDLNALGAHIFSVHKKSERTDFNSCFVFDILCSTSPDNIRKSEQSYIDRLKSKYPFGLNNANSVSGI